MVGDYVITKNPVIHSVDEEIPEYIVDRVIKEFNLTKEVTFIVKPTYINKEIIKQMFGEK